MDKVNVSPGDLKCSSLVCKDLEAVSAQYMAIKKLQSCTLALFKFAIIRTIALLIKANKMILRLFSVQSINTQSLTNTIMPTQ